MDRGIIVGGGLIAASFLVAVLLNGSAPEEAAPLERAPPSADVCKDPDDQHPPGPGQVPEVAAEECKRKLEALKR